MARRITSIEINNYKAFKSSELDINKLNILLGTNSSGKSSLIKLLLMLSQSIESSSDSFLDTFGGLTDLGDIDNIFFNKKTENNVKLKFNLIGYDAQKVNLTISIHLFILTFNLSREIDEFKNKGWVKEISEIIQGEVDENNKPNSIDALNKSKKILEKLSEICILMKKDIKTQRKNDTPDIDTIITENSVSKPQDITYNKKINSIINAIKSHENLLRMEVIDSFEFEISKIKNKLKISKIALNSDIGSISISFVGNNNNRYSFCVSSTFFDCKSINRNKKDHKELFNHYNSGVYTLELPTESQFTSDVIYKTGSLFPIGYLTHLVLSVIPDEFNPGAIHHVSPLRFSPERYFLMSNEDENKNISSSGKKILTKIKESPKLKTEINRWMKKFDIEIGTNDITHIIHSIKVTNNGLSLDITDVGFGVSQVLPVILISLTANKDDLVLIEQPEVHIHPKMQSELADFFIDQTNKTGAYFIIETHSEALLKRLRLRMAENSANSDNGISNENVSIQFIEKRDNKKLGATIRSADISPTGKFEWPKDFKENDVKDTLAFMKYQG